MTRPTLARFFGQAAIWGSSFTLIKFASADVGPGLLVVSRLAIGALVLAIVALLSGVSLRMSRIAVVHVAVSALFANVIPYLLLTFGERSVGAGIAGVLIGATPVFTLVIARLALRERNGKALGFVVAFGGVVLVVAPWVTPGGYILGGAECFAAAVSYAVGYVYVRRFLSPLGLAPLGALSTGLANILYFRLIQDIGAAGAAAVDYVVPVFAVLFGALLLGEAITGHLIAGGLVILAGMALAEGRIRRPRESALRRSTQAGVRAGTPSEDRRGPR